MHILMIVNDRRELGPRQTTTMLVRAILARGWRVSISDVAQLGVDEVGDAFAHAAMVDDGTTLEAIGASAARAPLVRQPWSAFAFVWLRTNPGRDVRAALHASLLDMARVAVARGVRVENAPAGLATASSKLFLHHLPAHVRPPSFVTGSAPLLLEWARAQRGPFVVKPLVGSRGNGVFRLASGDADNVRQIVEWLTEDGVAIAQPFLPAAVDGDTRVVLLDGAPIRIGAHVGGVRLIPPDGDFRSNVHVGASTAPVQWTPNIARVAEAVGPVLVAHGIRLAGLDVIGDVVVEVNVFSTGGLFDAERFSGVDFSGRIVEAIADAGPPSVATEVIARDAGTLA